jgi:hypothetical protein
VGQISLRSRDFSDDDSRLILFHSFCEGAEARHVRLGGKTYRMIGPETRFVVGLRFLCYLLFKFSSIPSVKERRRDMSGSVERPTE